MIIYTKKDLIEILPILDKEINAWEKCGLNKKFIQHQIGSITHSILYIDNLDLFNNNIVGEVEYLTEQDSIDKDRELKCLTDEENGKILTTDKRIDILRKETSDLVFMLMEAGVI